MNKDEYIKKLERRIHNQRVALHENWMIVGERIKHRPTQLRSMWFNKVKKLSREVQELRKKLEKYNQPLDSDGKKPPQVS